MQNMPSLYKQSLLTIVSLLIISMFYSCEKGDDVAPKVTVSQPAGGMFSVMDTIRVRANISDNEQVKLVSIHLFDKNNRRVAPSSTYFPNSGNYDLDASFVIDNLYLESGSYYLIVEAKDEFNSKKVYVSIQVGAIERVLDDILIVEKYTLETKVFSVINQKNLLRKFPYSYQDFLFNPYTLQYLFLTENGVLYAYLEEDIKDEALWQITDLKDPIHPFFGKLKYINNNTLVSHYKGEIRSYNKNGQLINTAVSNSNTGQVRQYYYDYDKIMLVKEPFVQGKDKIECLNQATGASLVSYDILFSPEKLLFINEDLCVIFGNKNNIAKACSLSTAYNVINYFGDFDNKKLGDAFKYSEYIYLLSLDNEIIEYDLANGYQRVVANTNSNVKFYHEEISETIFYIDGNFLYRLNYPEEGSTIYFANNNAIDDLHFTYNK